ncbi:MAG: hypothetical protein IPN16_24935 [Gemmatimonadetes bacterium]|nr:hypothetical protein [Gemmatimonadota bacterium]
MIGPTTPTGGERSVETEHRGLSLHRASTTQLAEAELAPVFRQAQRHLTRYAARLVEEDETEDVVQETLLKFVDAATAGERHGGRPPSRARACGAPAAALETRRDHPPHGHAEGCSDRPGARASQGDEDDALDLRGIRDHSPSHEYPAAREDDEIRSAIQYALLRLPAYMREPWVMVKEQGFSVDETAHHFGITRASVRAAMAEANRAMRPHLERFGITPDIIRGRDIE